MAATGPNDIWTTLRQRNRGKKRQQRGRDQMPSDEPVYTHAFHIILERPFTPSLEELIKEISVTELLRDKSTGLVLGQTIAYEVAT